MGRISRLVSFDPNRFVWDSGILRCLYAYHPTKVAKIPRVYLLEMFVFQGEGG